MWEYQPGGVVHEALRGKIVLKKESQKGGKKEDDWANVDKSCKEV